MKVSNETPEQRIERLRRRCANEFHNNKLELWKGTHKRLEDIESDDEYVKRKVIEKDLYFMECVRVGKVTEAKVAEILSQKGFHIIDISEEIESDNGISPFDMIILSELGLPGYIADIKSNTPQAGDFCISPGWRREIERWGNYDIASRIPTIAPEVNVSLRKIVLFYSDKPWMQEYTKNLPYIARFIESDKIHRKRIPYKDTSNVSEL